MPETDAVMEPTEIRIPRIMLAAPASGSGKTVITCALLEALKSRGASPAACKCGPDYIDPMFHREVLGVDSRNLDSWFAGESGVRRILAGAKGDHAVLEGVMGIYDGADPGGLAGSCYEIARMTETPILLVVDARGAGRTILSVIKGILADDRDHLIRGLLLNRISTSYYQTLRPILEKELSGAGYEIRVLGGVPVTPEMQLESRHLGLVMPSEINGIRERIRKASEVLRENADLDALEKIMQEAPGITLSGEQRREPAAAGRGLVLAVARDSAFCFCYRENLEMFEKRGVELRFFSPLTDSGIPEEASGILLGGGYPECFLRELSENTPMLTSLRDRIENGIPSLAECGGFMYLHERIIDGNGDAFSMVGAVHGECRFTGHLVRFGYMELLSSGREDALCRAFTGMKGHEFHYYDSSCNGDSFTAGKPFRDLRWECMIAGHGSLWGFPHLYYASRPEAVDSFIESMRAYHDQ